MGNMEKYSAISYETQKSKIGTPTDILTLAFNILPEVIIKFILSLGYSPNDAGKANFLDADPTFAWVICAFDALQEMNYAVWEMNYVV